MTRQLSLLERYAVARTQVGASPIVCVLGQLDLSCAEAAALVGPRIDALLHTYPLLHAAVKNSLTTRPEWVVKAGVSRADILSIETSSSPVTHPEQALSAEKRRGEEDFDPSRTPLWRVAIYPGSRADECYVACTVHHAITDGRGLLHLFRALFAADVDALKGEAGAEGESTESAFPPKEEDTLDVRPSYLPLIKTAWRELIVKNFPAVLRKPLEQAPAWPANIKLASPPVQCDIALRVLDLDGSDGEQSPASIDIVAGLKSLANQIGSKTIHSLLHTACSAALLVVFHPEPESEQQQQQQHDDVRLETLTPVSLRARRLGHPQTTGNYIGSYVFSRPIARVRAASVAQYTRAYHAELASPRGRRDAAGRIGMLAYIPDHAAAQPSPASASSEPEAESDIKVTREGKKRVTPPPTGWEAFLRERNESDKPYGSSIEISTLGLLNQAPEPLQMAPQASAALRRIWFSQTPQPNGAPFSVDVVGYQPPPPPPPPRDRNPAAMAKATVAEATASTEPVRLSIVVSWRRGALPEEKVERYTRLCAVAVRLLARAGRSAAAAHPREAEAEVEDVQKEMSMEAFCKVLAAHARGL